RSSTTISSGRTSTCAVTSSRSPTISAPPSPRRASLSIAISRPIPTSSAGSIPSRPGRTTPRSTKPSMASAPRPRGSLGRPSPDKENPMIKGLHHNAYRCRDSEETRKFYEDFLGLPLVNAFKIETTQTGRKTGTGVLPPFFQLDDGSCLAFFEAPDMPFEFKEQHDFDLHIALEVEPDALDKMFAKGKADGREVRGVSDHKFIRSIYFRDPNGYVIELTAKVPGMERDMDPK